MGFQRPVPGDLVFGFKKPEERVEEMTQGIRALAVKSEGHGFKSPNTHVKAKHGCMSL